MNDKASHLRMLMQQMTSERLEDSSDASRFLPFVAGELGKASNQPRAVQEVDGANSSSGALEHDEAKA